MRSQWLQHDGRSQVLVFFAGWGMDAAPFSHLTCADHDLIVCFDYRDPQVPGDLLDEWMNYDGMTVVAWSFGCAVAAHAMLAHPQFPVSDSLAINGTVSPASDDCGIPSRMLDATARNLSGGGWGKFVRRMCRGESVQRAFEQRAPQRDLQEMVVELQSLRDLKTPPDCRFARALIGTDDRIIAPQNQQRGWERFAVPTCSFRAPHYPFHLWTDWEEVLAAGRH